MSLPATARELVIITIGNESDPEFSEVQWLLRSPSVAPRCRNWPRVADFLKDATGQSPADLVVVWQRWSHEYTAEDIQQLLAAVPLSRVCCVYGPWCEADGRSRSLWPPALRVPVWQAARRLEQEISAARDGHIAPLPWTAAREEAWLHDTSHTSLPVLTGLTIAIDSPDAAYRQMLVELLTAAGADVSSEDQSVAVRVFDLDPWTPQRADLLSGYLTTEECLVIGVSDWTTADRAAVWTEAGIAAVVSKLDPLALPLTIERLR